MAATSVVVLLVAAVLLASDASLISFEAGSAAETFVRLDADAMVITGEGSEQRP
jgi:hypothetical protein